MKKLILISIMIAISLTGCKTTEEDDDQSSNPIEITPITEIRLNGGGDFLFKNTSQSLSSNISNLSTKFTSQSTSSSTGTISTMYTFSEEDLNSLLEVVVIGGAGKTQTAAWKIVNSTNFIAGIKSVDVSGDVTTCFVRPNNLCVELSINPDPLYDLNGAPHFFELDTSDDINPIYYRHGQDIHALYIDSSGDATDDIFMNANQLAINVNGDMMIEDISGDINYRKTDGSLWSTDDNYSCPDTFPGEYCNAYGSVKKFFFPSNNGFMVKCGGHSGYPYCQENELMRFYTDDSDNLKVTTARSQAWINYINYGLYYPATNPIKLDKTAPNCYTHDVSNDSIIACGIYVWSQGDESNDIKFLDLGYQHHSIINTRVVVSDNYIYVSSASFGNYKITGDILFGSSATLFTLDYGYDVNILTADTSSDTGHDIVRYCGKRISDNADVIVQQINSDTASPIRSEILSTCDNLIHL